MKSFDFKELLTGMNKCDFWNIIEGTKGASPNPNKEDRYKRLADELSARTVEEVESFYDICFEYLDKAYSEDVWGAAQIITTHCPDKEFVEFRFWLIFEGEKMYNNVLENPDILAEYPKQKLSDFDNPYSSNLIEIVTRVYKEKTGELLWPPSREVPLEPEGKMIAEDDYESLRSKYPRLFEKYYSYLK